MNGIVIAGTDVLETALGAFGISKYVITAEQPEGDNSGAAGSRYLIRGSNGEVAAAEGINMLGLPIYQIVRFTDGNDSINIGDCIVNIELQSTVVKTAVQGHAGTVKEFINNDDYVVTIRGLMVGTERNKLPEALLRDFRKWFCDKPKALGVEGKIFEIFGIHSLVVTGRTLPQLQGMMNTRPFELKCISDAPYELMLENDV